MIEAKPILDILVAGKEAVLRATSSNEEDIERFRFTVGNMSPEVLSEFEINKNTRTIEIKVKLWLNTPSVPVSWLPKTLANALKINLPFELINEPA